MKSEICGGLKPQHPFIPTEFWILTIVRSTVASIFLSNPVVESTYVLVIFILQFHFSQYVLNTVYIDKLVLMIRGVLKAKFSI